MGPNSFNPSSSNQDDLLNHYARLYYHQYEYYITSDAPTPSLPYPSATLTPMVTPQSTESFSSYSWMEEHEQAPLSIQCVLSTDLIYSDNDSPFVLGSDEVLFPPLPSATVMPEKDQSEFDEMESVGLTTMGTDTNGLPTSTLDFYDDILNSVVSGPLSSQSLLWLLMTDLEEIICMSTPSVWDPTTINIPFPPAHSQKPVPASRINSESSINKKKLTAKRTAANKKKVSCEFIHCRASYSRNQDLKRHINTGHTLAKVFECNIPGCQKTFPRLDSLKRHISKVRH